MQPAERATIAHRRLLGAACRRWPITMVGCASAGRPQPPRRTDAPLRRGDNSLGLLRARCAPVCIVVWDSPADVWPTAFPGFRREARLTPGYARTAFQAKKKPRRHWRRLEKRSFDVALLPPLPIQWAANQHTVAFHNRIVGAGYAHRSQYPLMRWRNVRLASLWYDQRSLGISSPIGRMSQVNQNISLSRGLPAKQISLICCIRSNLKHLRPSDYRSTNRNVDATSSSRVICSSV